MTRQLRVVVIGAGMSGVLSALRFRDLGHDVVVLEKESSLGGTWRDNSYPGVACDVPSHVYSYSFELNPDWSRSFSPGSEILAYLQGVADRHGVTELIRFGSEVDSMVWDGETWTVGTADGARLIADVVIAATGVLHHPRLPDIDGLDTFAGASFHSARWDHSVALDGARIGVIGTGSTAVQITTALVDRAAHFTLFQRTPQWVLPMDNPELTDDQRTAFRADRSAMERLRHDLADGFRENFADVVIDAESPRLAVIQALCEENLDRVADPTLREALRPHYRAACKRLVVSPDFYECLQRPNAAVVTSPIVAVEPAGVRTADGRLHELDVLVLATGFQVDRFLRPMTVTGEDGLSLEAVWAERPSAYLSVAVPGFPNLFLLNGPNGPVGNFSLIEVAEIQQAYLERLLAEVVEGRCSSVAADAEAAARFEAERIEAAAKTVWVTGCDSWYLDSTGVPAAWPWTLEQFRARMAAPDLADFVLR